MVIDRIRDRIRQAFSPPVFEDDERTQGVRRLSTVIGVDFALLAVMAAVSRLDAGIPQGVFWMLIGLMGLLPVIYFGFVRRGRVMTALILLISCVSLCLTGGMLVIGSARSPIISGYLLIIITLGLVRNKKAVLFLMALNILLGVGVGLLDMLSRRPTPAGFFHMMPMEWLTFTAFMVYAAVFTYFNRRGFIEAFDQAQREIRERARAEAEVRRAHQFTKDLLASLDDPVILKGSDGRWMMLNQAARALLKDFGADLVGKHDSDFFPPDQAAGYTAQDREVLETGKTTVFEESILLDGQPRTIAVKKSRFVDPKTGEAFIAMIIRDITERQRAGAALEAEVAERTAELRAMNRSLLREIEERQRVEASLRLSEAQLRASEERYALAARGANDGLWDADLIRHTLYVSPRWLTMLGFDEDDPRCAGLTLTGWIERIHPEDRDFAREQMDRHLRGQTAQFECEFRIQHEDHSYRWVLCRGIAVRDAEERISRIAGSMTDITERKRIEHQLMLGAFYDPATGLPNRALLTDRLEQAIRAMKRHPGERFAILFMDLDRFKDVNDSLGHSAGDELLVAVAQRVKETLRVSDTLARLGGDEFVILLPSVGGLVDAVQVAERVNALFKRPFDLSALPVTTTASIGIVLGDDSHAHAEDVLRDADIAMYRAKMNGKDRYHVFDASMRSHALSRIRTETDLRKALAECAGVDDACAELSVYYQPIISLESGKLHGFEALTRWKHPTRGFISPEEFIPVAEDSLLILPLDLWALREACLHMKDWQRRFGDPSLSVSVNLSGKHFTQPDLAERVKAILQEARFPAVCLRLEITESAIMENIEMATHTLKAIQGIGVQIQIDDFGTGFSSLTYLFQIPFNTLKIDRSFVGQLGLDRRKSEIVSTIVRLAHNIGMDVVAEGVETFQQAAQLRSMGCDYGQGFLYSHAVEADQAARMIEKGLSS